MSGLWPKYLWDEHEAVAVPYLAFECRPLSVLEERYKGWPGFSKIVLRSVGDLWHLGTTTKNHEGLKEESRNVMKLVSKGDYEDEYKKPSFKAEELADMKGTIGKSSKLFTSFAAVDAVKAGLDLTTAKALEYNVSDIVAVSMDKGTLNDLVLREWKKDDDMVKSILHWDEKGGKLHVVNAVFIGKVELSAVQERKATGEVAERISGTGTGVAAGAEGKDEQKISSTTVRPFAFKFCTYFYNEKDGSFVLRPPQATGSKAPEFRSNNESPPDGLQFDKDGNLEDMLMEFKEQDWSENKIAVL